MGTNITGIGNANAIGFKSRVTGGIYFPPELKDALVGVWSAYGKSNYIVFPVADIDEEKSAKIDELNLVPRSNVSKDKVLMKCQHYKEVFPEKVTRTVTTDEEGLEIISIEYPYETYSNEALATLLSSPEWNFKEDEVIEDSPIEE